MAVFGRSMYLLDIMAGRGIHLTFEWHSVAICWGKVKLVFNSPRTPLIFSSSFAQPLAKECCVWPQPPQPHQSAIHTSWWYI